MSDRESSSGAGRLTTGLVWAVLLLGLWLWASEVTDVRPGTYAPTTGDVAAVGRPLGVRLPPAAKPLREDGRPRRLVIPSLGVRAPVMARGLDARGAVEAPPYAHARAVGWYGAGVRPGAEGAALLVGHVDTESRPAVFYRLSELRPGEKVRVIRDDGTAAEFTVDDVQVIERDRFDAQQAYGVRQSGRAELRLITCGGSFDPDSRTYTANVVASAYLTNSSAPGPADDRSP
ncbi:class F sortase [Streptomyces yerevanensis]|uniref:class F sortase n=1 Tax=Streptomyces yerevanensis TaxID=66378 RepID=UPI0005265F4C|nr:class F sortase [Streptomyces yerevanensis]